MTRPHRPRLWPLACVLLLALVMSMTWPCRAWGGRPQHGVSGGASHRHGSHRHGSHHRGHYYYRYPRPFFGLYFFDYPYPYYGPYYYEFYTTGAHQRFPAFRLPEFFHYPGAIGKGEVENPQDQDTAVPLTPQRSIQP
jgi:hypothetical protein